MTDRQHRPQSTRRASTLPADSVSNVRPPRLTIEARSAACAQLRKLSADLAEYANRTAVAEHHAGIGALVARAGYRLRSLAKRLGHVEPEGSQ